MMVNAVSRALGVAGLGALLLAGPATAQDKYPAKAITVVVTQAPGGANDTIARIWGQKLSENIKQPVIDRLAAEINKVMSAPAFKQKALEQGATADYMSPQQLANYSNAEYARWGEVVKAAKIEAD